MNTPTATSDTMSEPTIEDLQRALKSETAEADHFAKWTAEELRKREKLERELEAVKKDRADRSNVKLELLRKELDETRLRAIELLNEKDQLERELAEAKAMREHLHGHIKAMLSRSETYRLEAEADGDRSDGEKHARVSSVLRELDRLATAEAAHAT